MENGVAYWAVKIYAIIKSDCQMICTPVSGVCSCSVSLRDALLWESQTHLWHRHAMRDLRKELSLSSHLSNQSAAAHLHILDAVGCAAQYCSNQFSQFTY